ncbi:MAG: helix-turn-helix domain-containing protein [Candidatus Coproplasma sp.]
MSVNVERFIDTVKEIITEKGLTATGFAEFLGIEQSCLSKWLSRENTPSLEYVILVADKTGVSVDYLFCLKDTAEFKPNAKRSCFAERLQTLLDGKSLSKNKLASECGVQSSTVSKWLLHGQLPKPETAVKLADYFGCSLDYLVGRE